MFNILEEINYIHIKGTSSVKKTHEFFASVEIITLLTSVY